MPETSWQTLASEDLDREQSPHLRISSAGRCPRALGYAAQGIAESNPPGPQARSRMALGHMAEVLIIKEMELNGWETRHTVLSGDGQMELELEVPDTDGQTIKGHPDGVCRHQQFTNNLWVPLECKSMSPDKALEVLKERIVNVYPGYLVQISLYGRALRELREVSHGERGVFGMMDREGRLLPPERAAWERREVDATLQKVTQVVQNAQKGQVEERPYAQSSTECKICSYHSLCWGMQPPGETAPEQKKSVTSAEPSVLEAARKWAEMKPQVDQARDMLQAVSNSSGGADVLAEGVIGGYFQPRSERVYDPDALERAVPADILERCRTNIREKPPAFWVRKSRD